MTTKQSRKLLVSRLSSVQARLRGWSLPDMDGGATAGGRAGGSNENADVADVIARDLANGDRERLLAQRMSLQAALERVDDGTYGLCSECTEAIPVPRLRVHPEAERCVPCQSRREVIQDIIARGRFSIRLTDRDPEDESPAKPPEIPDSPISEKEVTW